MKKLLLFIFVLSFSAGYAQTLLFNENFNYAANDQLITHNWLQSGTTTSNPIVATSPGLTLSGYPSVAGNACTLATSGQDVYQSYTPVAAGSIYFAFLINVQAVGTGDYFIAVSPSTAQTNYYARTHIKSSGSGFSIGISKSNEVTGGASYGTTVFNLNTTYLVVVKHSFIAGDMNDAEKVFVFSSTLPATEPATAEITSYIETTKSDPVDLGMVTLRQGSTSAGVSPALIIDGVRISDNWGLAVTGTATGVEDNSTGIPTTFELSQNYPNPFNPSTVIKYQIPQNSFVNINVYDVLGNQVRTLVREDKAAGSYSVKFDASNIPSGVYFYTIQAGAFSQTKKMILMK